MMDSTERVTLYVLSLKEDVAKAALIRAIKELQRRTECFECENLNYDGFGYQCKYKHGCGEAWFTVLVKKALADVKVAKKDG